MAVGRCETVLHRWMLPWLKSLAEISQLQVHQYNLRSFVDVHYVSD